MKYVKKEILSYTTDQNARTSISPPGVPEGSKKRKVEEEKEDEAKKIKKPESAGERGGGGGKPPVLIKPWIVLEPRKRRKR